MPVRSSGCAMCRKRRIRCDEARPGCQKCATHGVACTGYRIAHPGGIEFKDVTEYTAQRATDQYRRKGYPHVEPPQRKASSTTISSSSSPSSSHATHTPVALTRANSSTPPQNWTTNDVAFAQTWADCLLPIGLVSNLRANPPVGLAMDSTNIMSTQIYSSFLDIYLPKNSPGELPFFQYLALRPNHEPALIRSLNALSLVAVGSTRKDPIVTQEAVLEYGRALALLARAVGKPGFKPTDEIQAAVTILAICEFYDSIKQRGGWTKHMAGAAGMLAARGGPDKIRSRLSLLLLSNSKHAALAQSLLSRKECLLGKRAWREVLFKCPVVDQSTHFYVHALQLPGLLQRADELDVDSPLILAELDQLLEDFALVELDLRTWFATWAPRAQLTGRPLYQTLPIDDFPTFASCVSDRTFEEAYDFPNYPYGYLACTYWCTMHFLRSTTLVLYKLRGDLDLMWQPEEEIGAVEADLRNFADNICRCLPYFCQPASSHAGHIGIFLPIGVLGSYFRKIGDMQRLKWVGEVHDNVFTQGLSPPQ